MSNQRKASFKDLLSFFPELELPTSFSEEHIIIFSKENKPLPPEIIEGFISKWETKDSEYTEFIPCGMIESNNDYTALVYWKGDLLKYEYIIVTLDPRGNLITKKTIASTIAEGSVIKKSVAYIDEDLIIHIVAGANEADTDYDADQSKAFSMEILPTGDIIFSLGS